MQGKSPCSYSKEEAFDMQKLRCKVLRGQHYKHICQLALTTPSPVPAPVPVPIPVPVAVPIPGPTPVLDPCPSQIYSDVAISRLLEQCHLGAFNDQVVRHSSIHLYKFHCTETMLFRFVFVWLCFGRTS